ncbi:MAG: DUF4360 domain-containing protein [Polyangiaceae bacterium]
MNYRAIVFGLTGLVCLTAWKGSCCPESSGEGGSTSTTTTGCPAGGTGGQTTTGGGGQGGSTASGGQGGSGAQGGSGGSTASGGQGGSGGSTLMPPSFTVLSTTNGGPGCPAPNSVDVVPDAEGARLSLHFPALSTQHTPGSGFAHSTCVTGVTLRGVPGMQFTATAAHLTGQAKLPASGSARIKTTMFFAGSPASSDVALEYTGPEDGPIDVEGEVDGAALLPSPCGADAIFNVQVSLTLDVEDAQDASITIDSAELPIVWNAC